MCLKLIALPPVPTAGVGVHEESKQENNYSLAY